MQRRAPDSSRHQERASSAQHSAHAKLRDGLSVCPAQVAGPQQDLGRLSQCKALLVTITRCMAVPAAYTLTDTLLAHRMLLGTQNARNGVGPAPPALHGGWHQMLGSEERDRRHS